MIFYLKVFSIILGDPGSIYIVNCNAGCSKSITVIHGSGIYD